MKLFNRELPMNFSKKTFAVTGLALAVSLAGCSSDNPDDGSSISKTAISGTAVDGYIAGATIYVDNNNDGHKGTGEPSAITDQNGYFSTSKNGIDYCADDATALQKLHCLKVAGLETGAVVRTFGGYDLFTGEPFTGSLSARIAVGEDGVVANQMVSPLTSVMVELPEDDQQAVLNAFGLSASDLEADFLDISGFNSNTTNSAIKLHKVVALLSEAFTEQYEAFGDESSFPDTPNAIIYKALAASIAVEGDLNAAAIDAAFLSARAEIEALYENDEDLTFPGNTDGTTARSNAKSILAVVDLAIPGGMLFADAKSRVIGVEAIVKKMADGDNDVTAAIGEVENTSSQLYTDINAALSNSYLDFSALTKADFSTPDYSDVEIVGNDSFTDLMNKQLYINVNFSGQRGEGYFFFNSEAGANGGELNVCLGYDDGVGGEPKFEETDGVLLTGTWLALDDTKLILNLAGSLSLGLLDKGMKNGEHRYSLNYGGEVRSWTSDNGLLDNLSGQSVPENEQPTDDESCAELLDFNNNPV